MLCINVDPNMFGHPKIRRLVGLLGPGSDVLPIKLWCHCALYHDEDGRLTNYDAKEVESLIGWWGESGAAVAAMVKVGLASWDGDTLVVNDWIEHQGHIAALKKKGRTNSQKRWNTLSSKPPILTRDASSNASSIPSSNASSNAPTYLPTYLPTSVGAQQPKPDPDPAVAALLVAEGFGPDDPILRHPNADAAQIKTAIQNADYMDSTKSLMDRRGFIVKAIENRYPLRDGAGRQVMKAENKVKADRVAARRRHESEAEKDAAEVEKQKAIRAVSALDHDDLAALTVVALTDVPDFMRGKLKNANPLDSPTLLAAIYKRIKSVAA